MIKRIIGYMIHRSSCWSIGSHQAMQIRMRYTTEKTNRSKYYSKNI
jgi:hypothetical protein